MGGRGTAAIRNSGTTTLPTTHENEYGFEVTNNAELEFSSNTWKKMAELRKEGTFNDRYLADAVDERISALVDRYGDLDRYDADLTNLRERIDNSNLTDDEYWAGYHTMADILHISTPRYSAGNMKNDDFYYDTQFGTPEQAEEWGRNRDLTHIYDRVTGKYRKIGGKNWTKG